MKFTSLLTIISLGLGSCAPQTNEDMDQTEYYIAYNVYHPDSASQDNYEVFRMNMDGSDKINLTKHVDVAWTYYAHSNRIFFISDRDTCHRCVFLYEMDERGKNVRKISDLRLEDSWMSSRDDGKEMIVSARIGNDVRYQLFIINTENGESRQLTKETSAMFRDPCFSPDGNMVVYAYKSDRLDRTQHEELYIMNSDGSDRRRLTHYPADDPMRKNHGYKAGPPRWNAAEDLITFQSEQAGKYSLYAINPDGSRQWKLTENVAEEGWHDWSADGKWLAIELFDRDQTQFHIGLMNWETKEMSLLTDTTFTYQQAPVFVRKSS